MQALNLDSSNIFDSGVPPIQSSHPTGSSILSFLEAIARNGQLSANRGQPIHGSQLSQSEVSQSVYEADEFPLEFLFPEDSSDSLLNSDIQQSLEWPVDENIHRREETEMKRPPVGEEPTHAVAILAEKKRSLEVTPEVAQKAFKILKK